MLKVVNKAKFKQTEIGEIPLGWKEYIFSEAVTVNPKRELRKGSTEKFVAMAELKEFNKKIQSLIFPRKSGHNEELVTA